MAWVLLDDNFPNHPKAAMAGPAAAYLYVCGLCYCRKFHTGGFIPRQAMPMLGVPGNTTRLASALVSAGLWDEADGGYQVHDYDGFYADEEDKATKNALREQRREAGRRGGLESGRSRVASHVASHVASSTGGVEWSGSSDHLLEEKKRDADFANFWAHYPRKDGKQPARTEWIRLKPTDDTQKVIIADLDRRKTSMDWLKDGGRFIPHARTYLHQRRWEDGFEERPQVSDATLRVVKGALDYAAGE